MWCYMWNACLFFDGYNNNDTSSHMHIYRWCARARAQNDIKLNISEFESGSSIKNRATMPQNNGNDYDDDDDDDVESEKKLSTIFE